MGLLRIEGRADMGEPPHAASRESDGNAGAPAVMSLSLQTASAAFTGVTAQQIAARQEDARTWIAFIIVGSMAFIVFATFLLLWLHFDMIKTADDLTKLIQAVLSPVVGIVGAVTGFYFGSRQAQQMTNDRAK
jgi:hypothetical protein